MAWSVNSAAVTVTVTGYAKMAITAARMLTATATVSITAVPAAIAWKMEVCATTANSVSSAVNARTNATDATKWAKPSARNVAKNVPDAPGYATNVRNAPTASAMNYTALTVIFVSNVPTGSVTAATVAPNVPLAARSALKNAQSVRATSFASTAGPALIA